MEEISKALQRQPRGVRRQLIYLGFLEEEQIARETTPGRERAGQRWNLEEDRKLERMFKDRMSVKNIAEELHRSELAVFCRMEKHELYGDTEGYPVREDLPPWKKEDNETLRQLVAEGKTVREIAEYFGRNEKSISARMFYMGLTKESPISVSKR